MTEYLPHSPFSGDMGSASIQTMEAISDNEQEKEQEELGKLTEADKAHTGRVSPVRLNNNNIYQPHV